MFTKGISFFAPGEAVLYHLWSRDYRPVKSINSFVDENEIKILKAKSINTVLNMLQSNKNSFENIPSCYGLGHQRLISEYENLLGVNFTRKVVEAGSSDRLGAISENKLKSDALKLVSQFI